MNQNEKKEESGIDDSQSLEDILTSQDQTATDSEDATAEGSSEDEVQVLEKLEKENQELKDKYLRLFAEFDNYKKRTVKERLDLIRTAAQDTLLAILPVLDDFDRARKTAEDPASAEVFSEGTQLVYHKLYAVLRNKGLEPMETQGQDFDPDMHEALTEIPAPSEELKGKVLDTIEKGYKLGDKIIRYAKVVVGN